MKPRLRIPFVSLLSSVAASAVLAGEAFDPILLEIRTSEPAQVSSEASSALAAPILLITDKPDPSPSGDPHDYVSYGRYWWPDPTRSNGLPYIRRDGHVNREQLARGDRGKIERLTETVRSLALGWHLEKNPDYARRAGEWLRAWFVTPATRMNPSLNYAQVHLGHDDNRGSNFGIIDARGLAMLTDCIRLLQDSPALSHSEMEAVRAWFADYLRWLTTSRNGRLERQAPNNHGTWYLAQTIAIARFLGDNKRARELAREDFDRIAWQFEPDGSQPLEIERTDALSYCNFNLQAQFQVATLAAPLGVDLWNHTASNGASLRRGLEFLRPFNTAPKSWPHSQLKPVDPGFLQPLLDQAARVWPDLERQ